MRNCYGVASAALIEHKVAPAMSAIFLSGWTAGYIGHSPSRCPFNANDIHRFEWLSAHTHGVTAASAPPPGESMSLFG